MFLLKYANIFLVQFSSLSLFFRHDYEAHTSCQTEDERYAAKGTFVAKDPKNKQKKKQMSWSEIIQSIADSIQLMQPSKDILNILKESDNVPRKEAKFKVILSPFPCS